MRSYRRRRRNLRNHPALPVMIALAGGASVWWYYLSSFGVGGSAKPLAKAPVPVLITDRPEVDPIVLPRTDVTEKGEAPTPVENRTPADSAQKASQLVESGKQSIQRGDLVSARTYFAEAFAISSDETEVALLRAELTRLGNETIFSPRILPNDPLVSRYVLKPGDTLGKIAKANKISPELLAEINGIQDINRIRAGQTVKIIRGPFRAAVHKSTYVMDVFLEQTLVKHFKVGLGSDNSTPTGQWRVGTKLNNPTYYPPRSGKIIAADDPLNPLGERWIALYGISGEAAGQRRYGIHGTIEPESIGQSVSLGCIRMFNVDVESLYNYLVEKHSTVVVMN